MTLIDRGEVRQAQEEAIQKVPRCLRAYATFCEEEIPWKCRRLVIGTGTGGLPVMAEVKREAQRRKIKLLILPTVKAIEELKQHPDDANAILHVTC